MFGFMSRKEKQNRAKASRSHDQRQAKLDRYNEERVAKAKPDALTRAFQESHGL